MTDLLKLILGVLASRFLRREYRWKRKTWSCANRSMCFAGEHRGDRTSTIRIVFYLFGSIAGFRPSLRRLRLSGRRPSFAGTVLGFGAYWRCRSRNPLADRRSRLSWRTLIGEMSRANALWGAPRIHGELLKLGFEVAQSTVARYMCRRWRPPSQGWRTFLRNHADGIAAVDLFVLPTIAFQILYCLVIVRHGRRFWVSFGVTANPTAEWISRRVTEAFPWDDAPRYLIRDRASSYGPVVFLQRIRAMGIPETIQSHPGHPGRMLTLRDLSARSDGNASTT